MAEHERYRHLHFANCQCYTQGSRFRLVRELPYVVSYEVEQVTYECAECGDTMGVFYRVPELERDRVKADKATIGKVIEANRFVAWVGYAKNPSTVVVSDSELRERTKELCAKLVNKAIFGKLSPGPKVFTIEQAEALLDEANWRVRRGFVQWAQYELRGEAYRTDPLRDRGFWFQDVPVEGEVAAIVACVTGEQVPAWDGYALDDYAPAYLSSPVRHSLYAIVMADGERRLVHPTDVEVQDDNG